MTTHNKVVRAFFNGKSAKGYAMDSDGQNLYTWGKQLGRTLDDGTKQLLGLLDVYTVSTSSRKHLTYAMRGGDFELIYPRIASGYEKASDFHELWDLLSFPYDGMINTLRATKQTWKTFNGAEKALKHSRNKSAFVQSVYGGYSIFFVQTIKNDGHVMSDDEQAASKEQYRQKMLSSE